MTNSTSIPTTQISSRLRGANSQRIDFSNLNFPNPSDARYATVPGMNNTRLNTNNSNVYITSALQNDRQVRFATSVNSSAPNTLPTPTYISNPPPIHLHPSINLSATTAQQPYMANTNPMITPYYHQYMNNLANIPPYNYLGYPWNFQLQSYPSQFALPFGQSTMYGENTSASNSFIPQQQTHNNTFAAQQFNTSTHNLHTSSNFLNNYSVDFPQQSQFANNWSQNTSASVAHDDSRLIRLLRDWKICFTGKPQEDADDFLHRLSSFARSYNTSDQTLLRLLPVILQDRAESWSQPLARNWNSFDDFKLALLLQYGKTDFQLRLEDEIRNRTQGPAETMSSFVAALRVLFDKLIPPIGIDGQFHRAFRNLHPSYSRVIRRNQFNNFQELLQLG